MSATAQPRIVFHLLGPSHPCAAVEAALKLKGLDYERVELQAGPHVEQMAEVYGEDHTTVPGAVIDDEPVHGSNAILARLEELAPDPALFPDGALGDRVVEAMEWGDAELQPLGRSLTWGALHFRPESMGTFAGPGAPPLDPAGTDFAIRLVRGTWKYHKLTAVRLAEDLAGLPGQARPRRRVRRRRRPGRRAAERRRPADRLDAHGPAHRRRRARVDRRPPGRAGRARSGSTSGRAWCPPGRFPAGWLPSRLTPT